MSDMTSYLAENQVNMNAYIRVRTDARKAFEPQVQIDRAALLLQLFDELADAHLDKLLEPFHSRGRERAQPGPPALEVQRGVLQANHHHRLVVEQARPQLCRGVR